MNDLRGRIRVETDGQLKTGRDVVIAALLGAEEFGFATAALVASGCILMRVCHLNTCPVGIATQDPKLRKKFKGQPEHVINFMLFIAEEVREIMAELGFRTVDEMVGRVDVLEPAEAIEHWKAKGIDLTPVLHKPDVPRRHADPLRRDAGSRHRQGARQRAHRARRAGARAARAGRDPHAGPQREPHGRHDALLRGLAPHGEAGLPAEHDPPRAHRLGRETASAHSSPGASRSASRATRTITSARGSPAGGSSWCRRAKPRSSPRTTRSWATSSLYGATGGETFLRGQAGERFAVRNSGATAVVEGVGDHGCEYMTKGLVVVLGAAGRNFAAGMSGGVAYVLDAEGSFSRNVNKGMVEIEPLDDEDAKKVHDLVRRHYDLTESRVAWRVLSGWKELARKFVRVMPVEYRKVLAAQHLDSDSAKLASI